MKLSMAVTLMTALTLSACGGKKNNVGAGNKKAAVAQSSALALDLSGVTIGDSRVIRINQGLTQIRGNLRGGINAIVTCRLASPINIKASLEDVVPSLTLKNVSIESLGLTDGSINTSEINRNGRPQTVIGMQLKNGAGEVLVGQKNNYVDDDTKPCTQIMSETYDVLSDDVLSDDGDATKYKIHIVSSLEGNEMVKSYMLTNGQEIVGIQLDKKVDDKIERLCVDQAELAINN